MQAVEERSNRSRSFWRERIRSVIGLVIKYINRLLHFWFYAGDWDRKVSAVANDGVTSTYTYGNPLWKDQLTAYNGQTITYDKIGNPLTYRDGITFTWQNGRQLASHTKYGDTTTYTYDAEGNRSRKSSSIINSDYYYVDGVLLAETVSNSYVLVYLYDESGAPYGVQYKGAQIKNNSNDKKSPSLQLLL